MKKEFEVVSNPKAALDLVAEEVGLQPAKSVVTCRLL